MTHSLHRFGNTESLKKDFVWFMYQAKGINDKNIKDKALQFIAIAEKVNSENWGDIKTGCKLNHDIEEITNKITDKSRFRGVFTKREQVIEFLKELKKRNLGMSVIISGLLDEVIIACKEADVTPHTINYSLGIWGKKEILPEKDVLAITTMCGHHMVASNIVKEKMEEVKSGKKSPEDAAYELAILCPCGIFNQVRAEEILKGKID